MKTNVHTLKAKRIGPNRSAENRFESSTFGEKIIMGVHEFSHYGPTPAKKRVEKLKKVGPLVSVRS